MAIENMPHVSIQMLTKIDFENVDVPLIALVNERISIINARIKDFNSDIAIRVKQNRRENYVSNKSSLKCTVVTVPFGIFSFAVCSLNLLNPWYYIGSAVATISLGVFSKKHFEKKALSEYDQNTCYTFISFYKEMIIQMENEILLQIPPSNDDLTDLLKSNILAQMEKFQEGIRFFEATRLFKNEEPVIGIKTLSNPSENLLGINRSIKAFNSQLTRLYYQKIKIPGALYVPDEIRSYALGDFKFENCLTLVNELYRAKNSCVSNIAIGGMFCFFGGLMLLAFPESALGCATTVLGSSAGVSLLFNGCVNGFETCFNNYILKKISWIYLHTIQKAIESDPNYNYSKELYLAKNEIAAQIEECRKHIITLECVMPEQNLTNRPLLNQIEWETIVHHTVPK